MPPPTTATRWTGPSRRSVAFMRVHPFDDGLHAVRRSPGQDAVPQIEDEAAPAAGLSEHVAHGGFQRLLRRHEQDGVEVSLDRLLADARPRLFQIDAPVHADDVAAGAGEVLQEARR